MKMKFRFIFFLLIFLLLTNSCKKSNNQTIETKKTTPIVEKQNTKQVSMILDVDKLIGLNINQIKNIIGEPSSEFIPTAEQKRLKITPTAEWSDLAIGLSIDYESNKNIKYIFVMNDGVKYSVKELLIMANLNPNSTRYTIEPQEVIGRLAGSGFTGIHVNIK